MVDLVLILSSGKGTWFKAKKLIGIYEWRNIFLITNEFGETNFKTDKKNVSFVKVNFRESYGKLIKEISDKLKGKLDFDVALNISSGTGFEHMAVITAMFKVGASIKFVDLDSDDKLILVGESDSIDDFFNS